MHFVALYMYLPILLLSLDIVLSYVIKCLKGHVVLVANFRHNGVINSTVTLII